ncbi:MAG: hypothetical protein DMF74_16120, partial [Acidobacteria bacterium]
MLNPPLLLPLIQPPATAGGSDNIMRLARVVSNQSRAVLVIVALLCVAGMYAVWQLPVAVFPETDFPRIVIIVDNGEAPAAQTLASVTRP